MSRFTGPQKRGAMREWRSKLREEARERNHGRIQEEFEETHAFDLDLEAAMAERRIEPPELEPVFREMAPRLRKQRGRKITTDEF